MVLFNWHISKNVRAMLRYEPTRVYFNSKTMAAAPQIRHFSEEDFLLRGLSLRCNGEPRRRKKLPNQSMIIEFQSVYGPHPGTIAAIWVDLQTTPNVADRIDESVTPDELLLVYRWFKGYESAFELKTTYQYPVKHIRNICRDLTYKLARLRKLKVRDLFDLLLSFLLLHSQISVIDWPKLGGRWRTFS